MKTLFFDDALTFHQRSEAYLLQNEAAHNLPLGIVHTLIHWPERFPHPPTLATVENDQEEMLLVALRTPPHNLVLSRALSLDAVSFLAKSLHEHEAELPGVIGPSEEAGHFVEAWQELTGKTYRLAMAERVYQLEQVEPVPMAQGELRRARRDERKLLIEWGIAFVEEALGGEGADNVPRQIDGYLEQECLYVWEDGEPVTMANAQRPTPNGICVSYVYTPPTQRRKGYATSCVAALSQHLLDQGRRYCFLFTDLANPTSNHIYQEIGYRPVCDVDVYAFR